MKDLSPYLTQHTASAPVVELTDAVVFGGPVGEKEEGFGLRDCWRVIKKHKWVLATFFFGVVLTTAIATSIMTPIYTAETTILIESKDPQIVNIQQVRPEALFMDEYDYFKTEHQILKSRSLIDQVIREQGLDNNDLFTGKGSGGGLLRRLWTNALASVRRLFSQPDKAGGGDPSVNRLFSQLDKAGGGDPLGIKSQVIDTYRGMLEIKPIKGTSLVNVAFSTPDPELSARVANAHAEAYIRQGVKLRSKASQEARSFLEEKLVELKKRLEESEAALNRYRGEKGILSTLDSKENIVVERLGDLNKLVTDAEAERITLEAQVRVIRNRDYDSLPAVINSGLIGTLKGQLIPLEGEYADLSSRYWPGYPRLEQLRVKMEETRRRLQQEVQKVVGGITSAYMAAKEKERELRAKMEEQKAATLALKNDSVDYAVLDREVNTNRQLYDSVLQRMKEMGIAAELRASNVFVLDKAAAPLAPAKPKKKASLLLGALVGLLGGLALIFFLEYLDNILRTPEEVERYLRLPNLGVVPDFLSSNLRTNGYGPKAFYHVVEKIGLGGRDRRSVSNSQYRTQGRELVLSQYPLSLVKEAYRTLRTAILLSQAGEPPKTILFTSGAHGEGKTATVINTAIIFAQLGVKVLVVDADLRRPSCHKVLGMGNRVGLADVLTGQRELEKVIKPTAMDNLFVISGGSIPPNPTELVGSKKMHEALVSFQEHYDYILIDSPPVIAVSDAVLLSTMVDGVVLVVNGQETPRDVVKETCSRLGQGRAKILGVVLNRVDMRSWKYAKYPYAGDPSNDPSKPSRRKQDRRVV